MAWHESLHAYHEQRDRQIQHAFQEMAAGRCPQLQLAQGPPAQPRLLTFEEFVAQNAGPSPDPYLSLIGLTRVVFLSSASDTLRFEVVLKVKGTNESEDKDFSFFTRKYRRPGTNHSCVINLVGTSRLSKLEWTFGYLVKSVEATINIQVIHGSWPNGCQGIFTASTVGLDDMKVLLLCLQNDKLPVTVDGMINLSRHVVSVEIEGGLKILVATENAEGKQVSAQDEIVFTPREAGRSCAILKVCSCVMKVVVAWSVVSWF
uniref:DUF6598 domain-containing protein n=1 Tax=Aegilops tauschii TaxID=37682 RepID=M8CCI9_AEGTA